MTSRTARLVTVAVALVLGATSCTNGSDEHPGSEAGSTTTSTAIALTAEGRGLWVVNPDADTVSFVELSEPPTVSHVGVGREPWAVAVTPSGEAVVMNRGSGSLSFVTRSGAGVSVDELPVGPEPGGMALSPDGTVAYVTLSGADSVAIIDIRSRTVVSRVAVGAQPWAVAVAGDGVVVISHRLARRTGGSVGERQGWLTLLAGSGGHQTVSEVGLAASDFGFPNALEALAVGGEHVFVAHLLADPARPNSFNTSVSGGLSGLSLASAGAGVTAVQTLNLNVNAVGFSTPTNFPRAVAVSPGGDVVYLVLAGTDAVMGVDVSDHAAPRLIGFWPAGGNPRGVAVSPDGTRAYVMNYLSRDVSVLDLVGLEDRREVARIALVDGTWATEPLPADLLRGKVLFNRANDPRLSRNGWLSCATCHLDGGGDGLTWPREEGNRQTMPLWSLAGTAPFHAAATRDELQDFEIDIERFMGGVGLAPGAVGSLLGSPNAGLSSDLDALADFVLHGVRPPAAPERSAAAVTRGRAVFTERGCHTCHAGPSWTTSALPAEPGALVFEDGVVTPALHDVGTFDPAHDITGAAGFDVPTLLGLAYTAPYFHDGSALTLRDVLDHPGHTGPALEPADADDLLAFLHSIDADSEPFEAHAR